MPRGEIKRFNSHWCLCRRYYKPPGHYILPPEKTHGRYVSVPDLAHYYEQKLYVVTPPSKRPFTHSVSISGTAGANAHAQMGAVPIQHIALVLPLM